MSVARRAPLLLATVAATTSPPPPLHNAPACVRGGGWHDIAAALSLGSAEHHVWQGCPGAGGWAHSWSPDFVNWHYLGVGPRAIHETYEGMASSDSPCSGFTTLDDSGRLCAGFRQCGSTHGTTGLNPAAKPWDVPLEIRCSNRTNTSVASAGRGQPLKWGAPQYLFSPYYDTNPLPYDPPRPWREQTAGGGTVWRALLSAHGCNGTDGHKFLSPAGCQIDKAAGCVCTRGGRLDMWEAPQLSGPWKLQTTPFFQTNTTAGPQPSLCEVGYGVDGMIGNEFVTTGVFGAISGDPNGGKTVVVTSNYCGNLYSTYWIGSLSADSRTFTPYQNLAGDGPAGGVIDYGPTCLVRTLGGDARNQVTQSGRRVMVGQLRPFPFQDPPSAPGRETSQSLARDITLSADQPPQLLQQFVPEFKTLRQQPAASAVNSSGVAIAVAGLQFEVVAAFSWNTAAPPQKLFGLCVNGPPSSCTALVVVCQQKLCQVQAWQHFDTTTAPTHMLGLGHDQAAPGQMQNSSVNATVGPMPAGAVESRELRVHAIGDGNILEIIWSNRTSTTLYFTPADGNSSSVELFGTQGLQQAEVQAWRMAATY